MAKSLFYAFRAWSDIQRFEPAALAVFYASAIVSLHLRLSELMFALIQFRLTFSCASGVCEEVNAFGAAPLVIVVFPWD